MGKLNLSIDDVVEQRFREVVGQKIGAKKGALAEAAQQAFEAWIHKNASK